MADFQILGLDELNQTLAELGKSLEADKVEPVLYDSAKIITEEVKKRAPVGPTGNLKRSIVTKKLRKIGNHPRPSIAAVDRKIAPHAHFVEFGTSKMSKKPFFRPGVEAKEKDAVNHVYDKLSAFIDEAMK